MSLSSLILIQYTLKGTLDLFCFLGVHQIGVFAVIESQATAGKTSESNWRMCSTAQFFFPASTAA